MAAKRTKRGDGGLQGLALAFLRSEVEAQAAFVAARKAADENLRLNALRDEARSALDAALTDSSVQPGTILARSRLGVVAAVRTEDESLCVEVLRDAPTAVTKTKAPRKKRLPPKAAPTKPKAPAPVAKPKAKAKPVAAPKAKVAVRRPAPPPPAPEPESAEEVEEPVE